MAAMGMVRACASPAAAPSTRDAAQVKRSSSRTARVLVLGGTGRVGGSAATALSKLRPDLSVLVGGRNRWGASASIPTSSHPLLRSIASFYPLLFRLRNRCLLMGREKGESFASKLGERSEFVQVDTRDVRMLEEALQG